MTHLLITLATLIPGQASDVPAPEGRDIPLLLQAIDSHDQSLRLAAAGQLQALGTRATPRLAEALAEGPPAHAIKAAVILRGMSEPLDPAAVDVLLQIVRRDDADHWRWSVAVDLLSARSPTHLRSLLSEFSQALRGNDPLQQAAVVRAARVLGSDAGALTEELLDLLSRSRQAFRHVLLERRVFTDNAVALTRAARPYDDLAILRALIRTGADPQLLHDALLARVHNTQPHVQLMVSRELRELGTPLPQAVDRRLSVLLEDSQPAIAIAAARELGEWGAAASNSALQLAELLRSGHVDVRRAAAVALGRMGPAASAAVPALQAAIETERLVHAGARAELEQALASIRSEP